MTVELSERQRYWVEHLRAAETQQVSLAAYAREQGLGLKQLYGAKSWLVKLGKWPRNEVHTAASVSGFVAVRIPAKSSSNISSVCCVLRHVSGWSLECEQWPTASWLRDVMHAAA